MDKSIERALTTWYPKDHPLHLDPHHPLGKLVGEWGELLDDYMKYLYKPGYEWQPLDELVDIWYYIRILAYQTETNFTDRAKFPPRVFSSNDIDYLVSSAVSEASSKFTHLCSRLLSKKTMEISAALTLRNTIIHNYVILTRVCELCNLTIDQLTEASWQKLKPGSKRGEEWMKARETTITKTS